MIFINYAEIKEFDVANSSGVSSTIFFSGCTFNCCGCFNKEVQNFNYGKPYTKEVEDLFISYLKHPQVKSACLLGGEVFQQDLDVILNLVKRIKEETDVNIWVWTGCIYEMLLESTKIKKILEYVDVLIDGQFVLELKDLNLKHRGSSNQRIIDVQKTLKEGKVVLLDV